MRVSPRRLLPAAMLTLLVAGWPSAAAAHPFGPPLTATVEADGDRLVVSWTGAEDDWVALGHHTAAFDEVADAPEATGAEVLATSPRVIDYIAGRTTVRQHGDECARETLPIRDLLAEGARFAFDCPTDDPQVTMSITVLADVNPAYRTVLTIGEGQGRDRILFTESEPEHTLNIAGADERDPELAGLLPLIPVVGLVGVGIALTRRKARR